MEDGSGMIKSNPTKAQSQNRACLIKIISCLCYLAHHGLPLGGHGNYQDSNFKQLLKCCAEDDSVFSEWLNRKNQIFTSPEIQNEILKEKSLSILRDIAESNFHSIMVDETLDVSNKEKAVFCVRWVNENLFTYKDFLGLHEMEKIDAISIANFIKDIILRLGFDSKKLQGQCYDS